MLREIKNVEKIVVLSEDNVIINVLDGIPATVEYQEDGVDKIVTLASITSVDQLRFSLPMKLVYVRLDKAFEQVDSGILDLTHDNYNDFISSEQAISL